MKLVGMKFPSARHLAEFCNLNPEHKLHSWCASMEIHALFETADVKEINTQPVETLVEKVKKKVTTKKKKTKKKASKK